MFVDKKTDAIDEEMESMFNEENVEQIDTSINADHQVVSLCDLITLEDLLEPCPPAFELSTRNEYVEQSDNDLSDASTVASIFVMELFSRVFNNTSSKVAAINAVDEIFDRAWKIIKPRNRWRQPEPSSWKVNVAKKRRADGLTYETNKNTEKQKIQSPSIAQNVNINAQNILLRRIECYCVETIGVKIMLPKRI